MTDHASLHHLARMALAAYPLHDARSHLISISENAMFRVDTAQGARYALRLHRPGYHDAAEIGSELAWLDALHATGLEVPHPVPGLDGSRIRTLTGPDGLPRHAVLFAWMEGTEPTPDIDPVAFNRLGHITARLHGQSRAWTRPAGFVRKAWIPATMTGPDALWGQWRAAPGVDASARDLITHCLERVGTELAAYGMQPHRFGLIHADLRLANLLVSGAHTRLIDFDDCGLSWFMQDLAAALSFHEDHPQVPRWVDHWLTGYGRHGQLDSADLDILPALVIQRRIQLLAWTGTHRNTQQVQSLGKDWPARTLDLCRAWERGRLLRDIG
ncbi:phosphotransferase enzyme family protein [Komagataeibacter sp. FNDCF1]|uniref:phosphotransferase enzyme family protein n=1 Tax=Komagataeibacter sp. FNDCF1 TaxID=2878681 RepID=UPI001E2AAC2B|nr:phosphotransferase [Komagataeibacter sp. FNDCF1]MCE2564964.1 phosphotransferase [Komagataeibacter sp. FNDCF1]